MRKAALILAVLSFPLVAGAARPGEHFGSKGTIAPSGSIALYTSHTGNQDEIVFALNPMAFYFVADNVAVGGGVGFGWTHPESGDSTTSLSLTPSVGYNVRLTELVSLFPYAGIGYSHTWLPSGPFGRSMSSSTLALDINAPFLVHFGNFYLGGGPFLTTELMSEYDSGGTSVGTDKTTNFGLATMIGGWF